MSNREEFEKWWRETKGTDIPYTGLASFTEDVMFSAWQARGELDAVRIEELQTDRDEWKDSTITANRRFEIAEDKVAELTAKLDKARENTKLALSLLEVNDMSDTYLMGNCITLAKQALELDK